MCWRSVRSSGFFGEGEPGALQILREGRLTVPAGRVPDLPPDRVEGLGRPGHDMERIGAQDSARRPPPDDPADPLGGVGRHVGEGRRALGTQLVEEALQRPFAAAIGRPHQTARVVVDDDHEVALATAVADLVDPDPA